jgi:hypothetical protein
MSNTTEEIINTNYYYTPVDEAKSILAADGSLSDEAIIESLKNKGFKNVGRIIYAVDKARNDQTKKKRKAVVQNTSPKAPPPKKTDKSRPLVQNSVPEPPKLSKEQQFALGLPEKPRVTIGPGHCLMIEDRLIIDLSKTAPAFMQSILAPYSFDPLVMELIFKGVAHYYAHFERFMNSKTMELNVQYTEGFPK